MKRRHLVELAGIDAITFESMSKRDELPFARSEEGHPGDYSLNEAVMLHVAADLRTAAVSRVEISRVVRTRWQEVWHRSKEVGSAALYLAVLTGRSNDDELWVGAEIGTLQEIEACVAQAAATYAFGSDAYHSHWERHRGYHSRREPTIAFVGGPLRIVSISLVSISLAFRDVVSRAAARGIEVPKDFLEFYGA